MATNYPKLRSDLVIRRLVMGGEVIHMIKNRDTGEYLNFHDWDWAILGQMNGQNSLQDITDHFRQQYPEYDVDVGVVSDFVDSMKKRELVELTPAERSIAVLEKMNDERKKQAERSQVKDVFNMTLATTNPERVYKFVYPYLRWIWTREFVIVTLAMFALAAGIIISNWNLVREGIGKFWRFESRTSSDIFMLFCILAVIIIIHESAHALTCINFGGEVHELGFMLMYFIPAFYANVSDAYLFDKKWHKYWVTLAGGYSELVICSICTYVWILSEPGTFLNHLTYNVMVFAGISTIIFNYNPLMKLDGYYLLTDILETTNLRANAIGYIVYLIKTRVFRAAAPEPPHLTPRKRRIFLIYGTLASLYTIFVVTLFILFIFRFFTRHFPEMGVFLGFFGAYMILRKRVKKLMVFSKFIYLDKREWLTQKASVRRWAMVTAALLLILLFYPFAHKVSGPVVLEPSRQQALRAETAGFVADVADNHRQIVPSGTVVVRLRNNVLTAARQGAQARVERFASEAARALDSGNMGGYQTAFREQQRAAKELAELRRQESRLEVRAPFDGMVLTPRLQDLVGKHVASGDLLCDFGDLRTIRARIEVSEFDFRELAKEQPVRLKVNSFPAEVFRGRVAELSQASKDTYNASGRTTALVRTVEASPIPAASSDSKTRSEAQPFSHFEVTVEIANPEGALLPGMSGLAKIQPDRHSIVGRILHALTELIRGKLWW
jgi:putative peptide zinc metalloprotease protein